jgi:hypothetical protein
LTVVCCGDIYTALVRKPLGFNLGIKQKTRAWHGFFNCFCNKPYPCSELAKSNSNRIEIKEYRLFDDKIFISAPFSRIFFRYATLLR